MKKENEHDIRNGPVRVYVANGKKSFVPRLEQMALDGAEMERPLTRAERQMDLSRVGYDD